MLSDVKSMDRLFCHSLNRLCTFYISVARKGQSHRITVPIKSHAHTKLALSPKLQVLIQDYDHLCPWTGTGIGRGNLWAFKWFVVSINILCYFSIALVAYFLLSGLGKR
mmetsp:Transcript_33948/g.49809  ORF Transcript_33948/g.49809 Transcript_33948/m.49809 type:complete len:109 (+) Transcript_33948:1026-1352(+)